METYLHYKTTIVHLTTLRLKLRIPVVRDEPYNRSMLGQNEKLVVSNAFRMSRSVMLKVREGREGVLSSFTLCVTTKHSTPF